MKALTNSIGEAAPGHGQKPNPCPGLAFFMRVNVDTGAVLNYNPSLIKKSLKNALRVC